MAAELVGQRLGLDEDAVRLLQSVPMRGSFPNGVPIDPTIYRFYEIVQVYGSTLKAHEEFGDGIMSGINFKVTFDRSRIPRAAIAQSSRWTANTCRPGPTDTDGRSRQTPALVQQ
jgi:cyanase